MKTILVISVVSLSLFQRCSASSSLIPSGISDSCNSYLTALNENTSLSSCTSALITASADYGPDADGLTSPSSSAVKSALDTLCSASTCSAGTLRTELTYFYSNCSDELTSSLNSDVLTLYDVVYGILPLKETLCTQDDDGSYCALESSDAFSALTESVSSGSLSETLSRRADSDITPDTEVISDSNLAFLFLTANLTESTLCTTCTRQVLTTWIQFESDTLYAPGISSSSMLSGQTALYNGVVETCGSSFLSGAVAAAGGLSQGSSSSGTVINASTSARTAVVAAVLAGVFLLSIV
ncbi:hypothetical protein FISHEDRAFT_61544 [Fistulina hepatica ATCC 64428]|uniref:Uncharacterized protein n=1 Tax=Fistulina hepatica ATCC 64428 TaxID=1128425 RepID=A0A0D7A234_9AGAR|nr:hypothetical protein FISHEDRAFT_61544 [Fistulina hepatica ATCC 64428]